MKKTLIILGIAAIFLVSCVKERIYPVASFSVSSSTVELDEIINFYNNSVNYDYVEWDFGDGWTSTAINPTHYYTAAGTYQVTLTAYLGNAVDRAYYTINVLYPTTLEVTVLEFIQEYPVYDANVRLYPSMYDWNHETNMVAEGNTNSNGVITFTGVNAVSYWLDVWHINYDNYQLAAEDENWIKTLPLVPNSINTFTAYVDYYPPKTREKSTSKERDKYRIVKIVRTTTEKPPLQSVKESK